MTALILHRTDPTRNMRPASISSTCSQISSDTRVLSPNGDASASPARCGRTLSQSSATPKPRLTDSSGPNGDRVIHTRSLGIADHNANRSI